MKKDFSKSNDSFDMGQLVEKVNNIDLRTIEIKDKMERDYVTQDQFKTVRDLVYGGASLILLAAVGAIIKLIFIK